MLGFVTRRRYETDLTAARAEAARQRKRADNAETSARTWQATAETAARQFAEADSANRRLAGRNNALAERLEAVQTASGFDRAQAKATADTESPASSVPLPAPATSSLRRRLGLGPR
jgi:hypothetical protein